jgi:hypothetical protein
MKSFKKIIESVRLSEKLSKSDPIDKWISDFVHSDDPKFDGKSKEERMKMAQGAYYGMQKESVEQIDELSKDTLSNYVHKSFAAGNELHNQIKTETDPEKKAKLQAKLSQRNTGVIKAAKKMKNEEKEFVGLNDFLEAVNVVKRDANGKVISWSHEGDWEKSKKPKDGRGKAANLSALARRKTEKLTKEEVEELDELDKKTLGSYVNKAHNQLMRHTASVNMKHGRGDADAQDYDLKHSRKADNRNKGIKTAISKLAKEEVEDLEEKRGLWDNIHAKRKRIEAGSGEKMRKPGTEGAPTDQDFKNASEETEHQKKEKDALDLKLSKWKNQQRAEKALKEEDTMLTYKDFLETISESRIDDIKDRLAAAREKRLNAYDFSKEKEKPKSNVTRHYAKYNDETDSNDEPEKPKEKRGRGRPAGSKSGARV